MKLKLMLGFAAAAALAVSGMVTVFAANPEDTAVSYGYLAGRQQNSDRHAQFESVASFSTDAEREAYFEAKGIGGGQYSDAQRLDTEDLVTAGIIDQATADSIAAYGSAKHAQIHNRYSGDMSAMTPDERHALYAGYEKDGFDGDSVDELLSAGIITQEQADAMNAYLG